MSPLIRSLTLAHIFDITFRVLIVLLPWVTALSVFTSVRLGIPGFSFLKEIFLVVLIAILAIADITGRQKIVWTRYDALIGIYIAILLGISSFTTGISGIIYGGRYDFAFLLAFFALFHGSVFLAKPTAYYLKLFLISGGIMIAISMLLKWPLSEDLLLHLGYSGNPSAWQFGGSIPVFHWVDGANVRRFQWLLDGPNTMWAFLLVYMGILTYYCRMKRAWHFLLGCVLIGFAILVVYTYSRSAVLGLIAWVGSIILFLLPVLYRRHRAQMVTIFTLCILIIWGIFFQYAGTMNTLITRSGSTSGHIERMKAGISTFTSHPLGSGLASSWPAYRYVTDLQGKTRLEVEAIDARHIPESWYIQQLVEGGIFGFFVWLSLMALIAWALWKRHVILFGMFLSILTMNLFLHTFESSVLSLSLFLLIGLLLSDKSHAQR
jgi:O-antigen ligase